MHVYIKVYVWEVGIPTEEGQRHRKWNLDMTILSTQVMIFESVDYIDILAIAREIICLQVKYMVVSEVQTYCIDF